MTYNKNIISAWEEISKLCNEDGLVCDIVIRNSSLNDWNLFCNYIRNNSNYKFLINGIESEMPIRIDNFFFENGVSHHLMIIEGVSVFECLFLKDDEIELTLQPANIKTLDNVIHFFSFIESLGYLFHKLIYVVVEGSQNPQIVFNPDEKSIVYGPNSNFFKIA